MMCIIFVVSARISHPTNPPISHPTNPPIWSETGVRARAESRQSKGRRDAGGRVERQS